MNEVRHDATGGLTGLLSRTGPEVPPDAVPARLADEPTRLLPVIAPAPAPAPAPVAARAVIVYRPEPRRRWGLLVFTAMLVALTTGVVLGQADAYRPPRPVAAVEAQPVPAPPSPLPPVSAPLAGLETAGLDLTGAGAPISVRSADLGELLFSFTALNGGPLPELAGSRLRLDQRTAAGPVPIDLQLNAKVRWTIRLDGELGMAHVDMSAGGLAAIDVPPGATPVVLAPGQAPEPAARSPR